MGSFDDLACACTRAGCSGSDIVCIRRRKLEDEKELLINTEFHRRKNYLCLDVFPIVPARVVLCLMMFLGSFVLYALRVNLSVAIVAMTNATSDRSKEVANASCKPTAPVFQWDDTQQGKSFNLFLTGTIAYGCSPLLLEFAQLLYFHVLNRAACHRRS